MYLPKLFELYLKAYQETEVYPLFHLFSLAAMVGAIANRKLKLIRGSALPPLYPNMWVVLVAPQGVGHKTVAIKTAQRIIQQADISLPIISAKITPEALVKTLSAVDTEIVNNRIRIIQKDAVGVIISSEFGVFLGKQNYNSGMVALLTDLYDCPDEWSSETIHRGKDKLRNVFITLLAASTPDWMSSMLPDDIFMGGFMSRLLVVPQPIGWNKKVAFPNIQASLADIIDILQSIANLPEMTVILSERAKVFFTEWYESMNIEQMDVMTAYYSRKQEHLLKLAMIFELSNGEPFYEISLESMKMAFNVLSELEKDLRPTLEYIASTQKTKLLKIIEHHIKTHGELSESSLLEYVRPFLKAPNDFDIAINLLARTKKIKIYSKDGEIYYVNN